MLQRILFLFSVILLSSSCSKKVNNVEEVNVYTHRHYDIDQKIYDDFEIAGNSKIIINAGGGGPI